MNTGNTLNEDPQGAAQAAFDELGSLAFGDQPLTDVLERTVELARQVVPVEVEASVTLIDEDEATTPAFTAQVALDLDETQYTLGYGPCLASAEAGQRISIPDMAAEERWPEFTRQAFDRGLRSTLSIPLPVQRQVIGALNLYASESHRFDAGVVVELADNFGAYAAVAIANTRLYLSAASLAEQMQAAMTSRAVIEQAKGMLMVQRQCNAEDAFDILVAMSQQTHRRLRHVATALVQEMTTAGD